MGKYTTEAKVKAVKLAHDVGVYKAALVLGISPPSLYKWRASGVGIKTIELKLKTTKPREFKGLPRQYHWLSRGAPGEEKAGVIPPVSMPMTLRKALQTEIAFLQGVLTHYDTEVVP